MKEYIVATGDHLRRLNQTGKDHYEECHGLRNRKVFCTQEYLRDRIREAFNNQDNCQPSVVIQTRQPNRTFEGLKVIGWVSGKDMEMVQCDFDSISQSFEVSNICRFQVCN